MAVDSSNRFPEIKTHVKQVASYISFLFNTFYFNTWISSFDRWLILLTFTICTRRACRVDLYFQIGPRHKLTSETVKGHSPHMAQHGWIYHCRAARCMRQARAVPAYKTHPQLLIFAAVKKSAPYTRVFTVSHWHSGFRWCYKGQREVCQKDWKCTFSLSNHVRCRRHIAHFFKV